MHKSNRSNTRVLVCFEENKGRSSCRIDYVGHRCATGGWFDSCSRVITQLEMQFCQLEYFFLGINYISCRLKALWEFYLSKSGGMQAQYGVMATSYVYRHCIDPIDTRSHTPLFVTSCGSIWHVGQDGQHATIQGHSTKRCSCTSNPPPCSFRRLHAWSRYIFLKLKKYFIDIRPTSRRTLFVIPVYTIFCLIASKGESCCTVAYSSTTWLLATPTSLF